MAVAHTATGSRSAGGSTTVVPSYPAGVAANRLAIASRVIKPQTATGTAEAGWTQRATVTGGTGTTGADTGQTRCVVDTKLLDGSESGSVTFDNAATPNNSHAVISIYQIAAGKFWDIATTSGSDATHGTGRSVAASPAISLQPGDVVLAISASDTDTATAFTSPAITATGLTFGATTERLGAGGTATGNQSGLHIHEATVATGTSTVAPALSLSGGPSNCGPTVFVRLREISAPDPTGTVVYVDSTTTGDTALQPNRAVPVPAGTLPYDIVVVRLSRWEAINPAVTTPGTEWEMIGTQQITGQEKLDTWAKRLTGVDSGTYTFSWGTSMWTTGHATLYRGVNRSVALSSLRINQATGSGTTFPNTTLNTVPQGSALDWHGVQESGGVKTQPTGYTAVETNDVDLSAYQQNVTAGNFTASGGTSFSTNLISSLLELTPEAAVGGTTPIGKDLQLVWNTRAAIGDPLQLVWNTRAAIGKALQAIWNVRTFVGDDLQLVWNTRQAVGDPLQLLWNTKQAVGDSIQLVWDTQSGTVVGKSLSLLWNTRALISDDLQLVWNDRAVVGDPLDLRWNTRAAVGDNLQLVWNVRILVGDPLQLVWNTRALAGDQVQLLWDTKQALGKSLSLVWDVQIIGATAVGKSLGLVWNVRQVTGDEVALRWNTRAKVSDDLTLRWDTRALAAATLDLRWGVRTTVGKSGTYLWSIRSVAGRDLILLWDVESAPFDPVENPVSVIVPNPGAGTISLNSATGSMRTVANAQLRTNPAEAKPI